MPHMNYLFTIFGALFLIKCITRVTGDEASVFYGDAISKVNTKRNAVADPLMLWPEGKVFFYLNSNLDSYVTEKILQAMSTIEKSVNSAEHQCISFVARESEYNYVDIFKGDGCYAAVGMENRGRQTLSLGTGCDNSGTIIHELLHSLGFYHEHNRYDRDDYVYINMSNIDSDNQVNFDRLTSSEVSLQGIDYDFDSIMNYDPYTLALYKSIPVTVPNPGAADKVFQMGQRVALSDSDVLRIQKLYDCEEDLSHIVRPEVDNALLYCNFQSDTCGMTDVGTGLAWVTRNVESVGGPSAGHSTGKDNYLVADAEGNLGLMAKVITPVFNKGATCIDFYLFLGEDGTSGFSVEASGPDFMTTPLPFTASSSGYGRWTRYQTAINLPAGFDFQITFKAVVAYSSVALDDLRIYTGDCN